VRLRFSDEELQRLVDIANHVAHTGSDWEAYARKAVSGDTLPSTHLLQHLLAEADKNGVPREETMQLRDHLDRIQHWERQAAAFLNTTTKQKRKPSAGAHRTLGYKTSLYNGERYRQLLDLRHRASTMAFASPYLDHIETLVSQVNGLQKRSKELLAGNGGSISEIQTVLNQGLSLNMDYEELAQLQIAVDQRRWISELEPKAMQLPLDCDALDNLLQSAHECKLPSSNPKYQDLLAKIRVGDQWIKRARRLRPDGNYGISNGGSVTMDELDEVLNVDQDVPTQRQLYQELQSFRMKISSWLVLFTRTMMQCQQQQLLHRPSFQDIVELKEQLNELPLHMVQKESATLDMELERLDEWTNTVKRLLSYRLNGAKSFDTVLENLQETIDHILAQHLKSESECATAANSPKKKSKVGRRPAGSYCICHESESGFMINCDVCGEWYHGACVKIAKRRLNHNEAYTCPVCDPASDFVHLSRRPKLEDLADVMEDAKSLRFVPESYPVLQKMIMAMEAYRQELRIFCRSKPVLEVEDLDRIKQYLRELLGLPIALDDETEFLRKKVNDISTLLSRQNHHQLSTINNHSTSIPSSSHPYNSKLTLNPQIVPLSTTTPADLDPHNMPDRKRKLKAESNFPNKQPKVTPAAFEPLPPPTTAGHPSVAPNAPSYYY
jgi:histone demethylase JARID1